MPSNQAKSTSSANPSKLKQFQVKFYKKLRSGFRVFRSCFSLSSKKYQQKPRQQANEKILDTSTPSSIDPRPNTVEISSSNILDDMSLFTGKLAGKVAIITGGSKGIGKATAISLAKGGAKVVINYSSDQAAADQTITEIGQENGFAVKGDAGSVADITNLVNATVKKFGKIDIVVANAGMMPMRDLESTSEQDFNATFGLNVKGPYFLAQKAAPHMSAGSHIIFISTSLCAISSVAPNYLLYVATKGAIEQMTRVIAKDLGRKQISVNCIAPGPTGTELFLRGKPENVVKMISGISPQGRLGIPEEIAEAITFLSVSNWVNGQTLRVNGAAA